MKIIALLVGLLMPIYVVADTSRIDVDVRAIYKNTPEKPEIFLNYKIKNVPGQKTTLNFSLPLGGAQNRCMIPDPKLISFPPEYKTSISGEPCTVDIYHKEGEDILFSYPIYTQTRSNIINFKGPFGPVVTKDYFLLNFKDILVDIQGLASLQNDYTTFYHIKWYEEGEKPLDNIFSIKGSGALQTVVKEPSSTLRSPAVMSYSFFGGKVEKTHLEHNRYLLTANLKNLDKAELKNFIQKYLAEAYKFWEEEIDSPYFVNIVEEKEAGTVQDDGGGMGRFYETNIFFYNINKGLKDYGLQAVVVHELMHKWIGNHICMRSSKWFVEGFATYFAYIVTLNATNDLPAYVKNHNDFLRFYYLHYPLLSESNKSWINIQNDHVHYKLGYILASNLDYQIKVASDRKKGLVDVIKDLKNSVRPGQFVSVDDFINAGNKYWPAFGKYVTDRLEGRATLSAYSGELGKCVKRVEKQYRPENYGFNYYNSLTSGVIEGVEEEKQAYQRGLRNGQKIISSRPLDVDSPNVPIVIRVSSQGEEKTFIIPRVGELIPVPQYEIDEELYKTSPHTCLEFFKP